MDLRQDAQLRRRGPILLEIHVDNKSKFIACSILARPNPDSIYPWTMGLVVLFCPKTSVAMVFVPIKLS